MLPRLGESVNYIPEVFVVKSKMIAVAFCVEGKHSKTQKVAVFGTLYPLSSVERADINEAGLSATRQQNVALMNGRNSLVYNLESLQQVVLSLHREAEVSTEQLYLW